MFFPEFILKMEDSYENIVSYRPLGASHQGPIDHMETRSTRSITMDTTSGRPSAINPSHTPQYPQIIPSYEESLYSQPPLPPYIDIGCIPPPPTKVPPNEPSNETLQKNALEPLYILTLNLVHKDATNIPPIPNSLTPEPYNNRTQFESLNLYRIFGCRQFRNQRHLTAENNACLVNSGLLLSTIGSFDTIVNLPK